MRYKIVMWQMMDQTLAIVSTLYEHYYRGTDYIGQYQLKSIGPDWKLSDLLRELADNLDGDGK